MLNDKIIREFFSFTNAEVSLPKPKKFGWRKEKKARKKQARKARRRNKQCMK